MKKHSRVGSVILIMIMLLSTFIPVSANNEIGVYLNGTRLEFDVPPQIIDGRTLVPMRKIFESLGAVVSWDDNTQTATGKKGDSIVNVSINSKTLFKNGVPKSLDVPPALIEGRTMVPVRAIAESFDCEVNWIQETRSVEISTYGNTNTNKMKLSALEISEKVSPSVFYIEVYDSKFKALGSGSGFFVSSNGVAITNYHVIEDTAGAQITTIDGEQYSVIDIIAFDKNLDVAIIRVDKKSASGKIVSGFPTLTIANSEDIRAGQTVFALGSPVGLQNTISDGIISNVKQVVGDDTFIQITAPISHGSSGGALVNEYGEVIGITSAGIDEAQNIGFAIPINTIQLFDLDAKGMSYADFATSNVSFILEVYPETVEIEVGETTEIGVYAEGKSEDWSIYWHTEEGDLLTCEWGDWLEDYEHICPLYITGKKAGIATITVYSDVDFKGVDITVYIKNPPIPTYQSSCVRVPTYTAITGTQLVNYKQYDSSDMYAYNYYSVDTVQSYVDYLLSNGFEFYNETKGDGATSYYYVTPENKLMSVVLAYRWNQVWIYIPRY